MISGELEADVIYKIIMNSLLVSIPEEVFVVLFVYTLMGEFDRCKDRDVKKYFQPWNYARVFFPAILAAIISNVIRYFGIQKEFITLGTILTLIIGIVVMGDILKKKYPLKWIGEVSLSILLCVICIGIMEFSYIPFIIYGIGIPLVEINNNILQNFLISIPAKIMQFALLAFLLMRKNLMVKARIIHLVSENQALKTLILVTLLLDLSFLIFMLKYVSYGNVLAAYSFLVRLLIIIGICLIPILNLLAVYIVEIRREINS